MRVFNEYCSLPTHSNTRFSIHVYFDGSVKDKDHNHDGAHDIADADNINDNEATADPHLTVEDSCLNVSGAEAGG